MQSLFAYCGFGSAIICSAIFLFMVLKNSRKNLVTFLIVGAVAPSIVIYYLGIGVINYGGFSSRLLIYLELIKNSLWALFIFNRLYRGALVGGRNWLSIIGSMCLVGLFSSLVIYPYLFDLSAIGSPQKPEFFTVLLSGLVVLWLNEQLYRNSDLDLRESLKFLCIGVLVAFSYDAVLYIDLMMFEHFNSAIWSARGYVHSLSFFLLFVAVNRNPELNSGLFVSRKAAIFSVSLLAVGACLIIVSISGYVMSSVGSDLLDTLQIIFLFFSLTALLLVMLSSRVRREVVLFVNTHFYQNKYDYREQWLAFTGRVTGKNDDSVYQVALIAVCESVGSPGGIIWKKQGNGRWSAIEGCGWGVPEIEVDFTRLFGEFDDKGVDVIAIEPGSKGDGIEDSLLPAELAESGQRVWWFVVLPTTHAGEFLIQLRASPVARSLDREDIELLEVIASQVSGYLALEIANQKLAESLQFEAYNRLSAFLVHDLKNVAAQLRLINQNSVRHLGNPEFVRDAFQTVGSAAEKIEKVLKHLKERAADTAGEVLEVVNLQSLLVDVVSRRSVSKPEPGLAAGPGRDFFISCSRDRLENVLAHLIQNCQEATDDLGSVDVEVLPGSANNVTVRIKDDGSGMSQQFVKNELFRPFSTTKGNSGMGIGMYESKHYLESIGGSIQVCSELGRGTVFEISLPLRGHGKLPVDPVVD